MDTLRVDVERFREEFMKSGLSLRDLAVKSKVRLSVVSMLFRNKENDLAGQTVTRIEKALGLKKGELNET